MDTSKGNLYYEKSAVLCFVLIVSVFLLSALIGAKISVNSGVFEGTAFTDRSSALPDSAYALLNYTVSSAYRCAPILIAVFLLFLLSDGVFFVPVSIALMGIRGAVFGSAVTAIHGKGELIQVSFYGAISLFLAFLVSYTVGVRMMLPDRRKPQRYTVIPYLMFSGICTVGEFLLPVIL